MWLNVNLKILRYTVFSLLISWLIWMYKLSKNTRNLTASAASQVRRTFQPPGSECGCHRETWKNTLVLFCSCPQKLCISRRKQHSQKADGSQVLEGVLMDALYAVGVHQSEREREKNFFSIPPREISVAWYTKCDTFLHSQELHGCQAVEDGGRQEGNLVAIDDAEIKKRNVLWSERNIWPN